jgi:hypothetical protein
MDTNWSLLTNGQLAHSLRYEGLRVIVANSNPDGHQSFVTDASYGVVGQASNEVNKVVLTPVGPQK